MAAPGLQTSRVIVSNKVQLLDEQLQRWMHNSKRCSLGAADIAVIIAVITCCAVLGGVQVRRKMEDENRKARRNARREYLDNVRELVAFVKKRDKRVTKAQVSTTCSGSTLIAAVQAASAGQTAAEVETLVQLQMNRPAAADASERQ